MNEQLKNKIKDYMTSHETTAIRVGMDWLINSGAGWEVLFWDELEDYVGDLDTFLEDEGKNLNRDDAWVILDHGNYYSMRDDELVTKMIALTDDPDFIEQIGNGKLRVPKEMADAIGLETK